MDICSPFNALTHSSLVSLLISWPPMARIWSPSTIPPQLQPALNCPMREEYEVSIDQLEESLRSVLSNERRV